MARIPCDDVVCTLCEGHYHLGLAALVNSLYRNGFRGVVWTGYRGDLPPWAAETRDGPGYREFAVADGCAIRFVAVGGSGHMTLMKPSFLQRMLTELNPDSKTLFFFDADIVVGYPWHFFQNWARNSIALCMDCSDPYMPDTDPVKHVWRERAIRSGYEWHGRTGYFNAGFIGIDAEHGAFLDRWAEVLEEVMEAEGHCATNLLPGQNRSHPFAITDQDAMNFAANTLDMPFAIAGPSAMGFAKNGYVMMWHAVYDPKPWLRRYGVRAMLRGMPPTPADFAYWEYADEPIPAFSGREIARRRRRLKWATRAGAVVRNLYREDFG